MGMYSRSVRVDNWFTEAADGTFGLKDAAVLDHALPDSMGPIFERTKGTVHVVYPCTALKPFVLRVSCMCPIEQFRQFVSPISCRFNTCHTP